MDQINSRLPNMDRGSESSNNTRALMAQSVLINYQNISVNNYNFISAGKGYPLISTLLLEMYKIFFDNFRFT
jgi:hypothetical protein